MRHFIIKDSKTILAIHKTIESSKLTFDEFMKNDNYENDVELICVTTNEYGLVEQTARVYSHSKIDSHTIAHLRIFDNKVSKTR